MSESKEYWNKIYKDMQNEKPSYDLWLDKYEDILKKSKDTEIIDLGCGSGGDTLYLNERGYKVIACDYSEEALSIINKHIPEAKTLNVDLTKALPFEDNSIKIIIADLSLHYFNEATTKDILREIKRVLKKDGYLIGRVNSLNDVNYGANQGEEVEKHYYLTKDGYKRFFDEEDIKYYFYDFHIEHCREESMLRYGAEKRTLEFCVQKN